MRRPVGPDQAVGAEVRVVRLVAEVAAVAPVLAPVLVGHADPVVDPLPDESTLESAVAIEGCEIVGEPAVRVAHCMGVLAEDHRPWIVAAREGLDVGDLRVHRTDDVGRRLAARPVPPDRPLVVERTRWVARAHPPGGSVVVRAVAALVPERPEDHRRMVLVALDHVLRAREERGGIARIAAQLVVAVVGLGIRLVDDVEPVSVAEVEPVRVVRIVRGADGVDVEAASSAGCRAPSPRARRRGRARRRARGD